MSVLDRAALEASPLADLHAIASELSIDGYRRLRRPELIDAILARAGRRGAAGARPTSTSRRPARASSSRGGGEVAGAPAPRPPRRPGPRCGTGPDPRAEDARSRRRSTGDRARARAERPAEDEVVEGVVELLPNGSGFLRVDATRALRRRRVHLRRSGQAVRARLRRPGLGPRRAPRRSERFASLVRIDTINGRPAAELADSARFDDLPAAFPNERVPARLRGSDAQGDRVADAVRQGLARDDRRCGQGRQDRGAAPPGRQRSPADEQLQLSVALAGVRPEEISEWSAPGRARPRRSASPRPRTRRTTPSSS